MMPDVKRDLQPLVTESPVVESVDLHCYDTEVVAILSGSSLWFTRELCVHDIQGLHLCLQTNTAHEVQARTIISSDVPSFIKVLPRHGEVYVGSCFLPPSTKAVDLHAKVCFRVGMCV